MYFLRIMEPLTEKIRIHIKCESFMLAAAVVTIAIKHDFHALTFARSRGRC